MRPTAGSYAIREADAQTPANLGQHFDRNIGLRLLQSRQGGWIDPDLIREICRRAPCSLAGIPG